MDDKSSVMELLRDLGIIVDCKLKFHKHIHIMVGKISGIMEDWLRTHMQDSKIYSVTLCVLYMAYH